MALSQLELLLYVQPPAAVLYLSAHIKEGAEHWGAAGAQISHILDVNSLWEGKTYSTLWQWSAGYRTSVTLLISGEISLSVDSWRVEEVLPCSLSRLRPFSRCFPSGRCQHLLWLRCSTRSQIIPLQKEKVKEKSKTKTQGLLSHSESPPGSNWTFTLTAWLK